MARCSLIMRMETQIWLCLVYSMLIVLGAPRLSKHICIKAGPTSPPPLSCAWSCPQTLWTLRSCLWRSLSRQAFLYSLSALEAKGLVSCVVHTTASFLQNLIELPTVWNDVLQLFIDLGLQTFDVFFWRVHKSKRLAPARFPLGAEEDWTS